MSNSSKIKVAVVGGSGYVGMELLRLLLAHQQVEVVAVTSRENSGKHLYDLQPALRGLTELVFVDMQQLPSGIELAFIALPHTHSMGAVRFLLERDPKLKIIDLGSDFRLPAKRFEEAFGVKHACAELIEKFVYGTPELHSSAVKTATLVANPGCFAHCITLALAPLASAGVLQGAVRVSALTGSSGSGAKVGPKTHHPERNESLSAYNVLRHRHVAEIEQALQFNATQRLDLVPLSGPFTRGIFATCFATLLDPNLDVQRLYQEFEAQHHFVRLCSESPRLLDVRGSNFCDIAVHQQGSEVVILAALDNLVKGAGGNAVQCMNLMYGLAENSALNCAPLFI